MHGIQEHALGSTFFLVLSFFIIIKDNSGQVWVHVKKVNVFIIFELN
jgi:hypothetical protein